jgi:heme-degrading monooxygenase HmoA
MSSIYYTEWSNAMATMMIQQQGNDFVEWKQTYNSMSGFRASNGALSDQVYHAVSGLDKPSILVKWNTPANAQKWVQSPELKIAIERVGIIGSPAISFLNEA